MHCWNPTRWARLPTQDEDPYVRKTGVICVGKLYDINAEFVESMGFIDTVRNMLSDSNPMVWLLSNHLALPCLPDSRQRNAQLVHGLTQVVANAVATLSEITNNSDSDVLKLNAGLVQKLLAALNECTEWGQVCPDTQASDTSCVPAIMAFVSSLKLSTLSICHACGPGFHPRRAC